MYDGTMRELKDVRYIPRMMKNLITIRVLEAKGLRRTLEEGILKMSSSSLVVLKSTRCNNLYYLMGNAVTGLTSSEELNCDSTRLWQRGLEQVNLKSDEALLGASTCNLESHDNCVLDKKKVKFDTVTHNLHGHLELVQMDIWGPTKTASLVSHWYFISIDDNYFRHCWVYPMR